MHPVNDALAELDVVTDDARHVILRRQRRGNVNLGCVLPEPGDRAALRQAYLYEHVDRTRSRALIRQLYDEYEGRCQLCGTNPGARYRLDLAEGHHLIWLSRGGEDVRENICILCPNHHSAVHRAPAVFDFADLAFRFPNDVEERLALNHHLGVMPWHRSLSAGARRPSGAKSIRPL